MGKLILILCSILIAAPAASGGTTSLQITRSDGDRYAKWERNGVRYFTRDGSVIDAVEKLLEHKRDLSREHAALGRKHAELGREHAALGRERARLGRQKHRRDVEAEMAGLERKQDELERRQREIEREQRELERRRDAAGRNADDKLDELFERAVRQGKAERR